MRPNEWRRLTRTDLRGFDDRATEIILMAMRHEAVGRISQKGHAILRGPGGQTMSVSRNTGAGNRGRQNMEADYIRIFGPLDAEVAEPVAVGQNLTLVSNHPLVPEDGRPLLECPLDECEAEFVTEGARYSHIQREHHPCAKPGCPKVFGERSKATGHFNIVHKERVKKPCPECGEERTAGGAMARHRQSKHGLKKKGTAEAVPQQRKPAHRVSMGASPRRRDDSSKISAIRELLGPDPRVAELEAQLAEARRQTGELEAKLALLREALGVVDS